MTDKNLDTATLKESSYSIILLALAIIIIFALPIFPQSIHKLFYNIFITALVIFAALSIDRGRGPIFKIAVAVFVFEWSAYLLHLPILVTLSRIVQFLFFIVIVISLITQIAKTKRVTARVITESISGYLLLGIVFSLVFAVIAAINPESFNFIDLDPEYGGLAHQYSDIMYYAFVTFTTLGYGDMLPITPHAKSLAVLAAVCGQIYLTVIIAMLVGKFLSHSQE